jgi:hypothetical protein
MERVKNFGFEVIYKKIFGKNVRFISNCEFFPNFDVIIKVNKIYIKGPEILFEGLTKTNKKLTIGSNMKNLQFEIV